MGITWKRCARCDREFPETMFQVDRKTGYRRDICSKCQHSEYTHSHVVRRRPDGWEPKHRLWSADEIAMISEGASVAAIASAIGRTRHAVCKKLHELGFVTHNGIIARSHESDDDIVGLGPMGGQ